MDKPFQRWVVGAAVVAAATLAPGIAEAKPISTFLNGEALYFSVPPVIQRDTTMVPFRELFEALGADVGYSNGTVTATLGLSQVTFKIGEQRAWVNGQEMTISVAPFIERGRTLVPLRFAGEVLGARVGYNAERHEIQVAVRDANLASRGGKRLSKGDAIASLGASLKGAAYAWGGTTPAGFDCSGFINYVFGQYSIDLPRTSYDLFSSAQGQRVSFAELQPGDILFFSTYAPGASHAGIYIGNNEFVHASTATEGVIVTSIYQPYYSQRLIGAKRFY